MMHRPLLHPIRHFLVGQQPLRVPFPGSLRGQKVELPLDAIRQVVGEPMGVAPAGVGVPGAQLRVHLLLPVLCEQGGLEPVPEPGAQCHHLHAPQPQVERVPLPLGGYD